MISLLIKFVDRHFFSIILLIYEPQCILVKLLFYDNMGDTIICKILFKLSFSGIILSKYIFQYLHKVLAHFFTPLSHHLYQS